MALRLRARFAANWKLDAGSWRLTLEAGSPYTVLPVSSRHFGGALEAGRWLRFRPIGAARMFHVKHSFDAAGPAMPEAYVRLPPPTSSI